MHVRVSLSQIFSQLDFVPNLSATARRTLEVGTMVRLSSVIWCAVLLAALLPAAAFKFPARGLFLPPRSRTPGHRGPSMRGMPDPDTAPPRSNVPRRSLLSRATALGVGALAGATTTAPGSASAAISADAEWPLWPALPVAPYSRRKTVRREVVPNVFVFDQFIGVYYVHVPIRMTVIAMTSGN